ncbi:MAG: tetratricopeptide repeat protein [Deltaproteobacteria bacterium]|nr:tetratricopeptide repeat protein [Deltaproteobacteria bacterium]
MKKFLVLFLLLFSIFIVSARTEAASVAFSKGQAAFSESDFKKALPLLQEAYKEDPQNPDHIYLLGLTYLQLDQYQKASQYLKEFLDKKPDFADAYFPYGLSLYRQKQYAPAAVWFEKAKEKDKKDPLPVFYSGLNQYYLGDPEKSLTTLKLVDQMAPNAELASAVSEWVKDIQEGKVPKEGAEKKEEKKWTIRVAGSAFYDSNVILDPDEGNIAGFQTNQEDAMAAGALDVTYLLHRTENSKLFVEYSGYQSAYANINFDFDRFNFGRQTGGINFYYKINDKLRWRMPLSGTFVNLGLSKYVLMGQGASYFDAAWDKKWLTTFYGKMVRNEYYASPTNIDQIRDATQAIFGFDQFFFVPNQKNMYFKAGYQFTDNFAVGNDWYYTQHEITAVFGTDLWKKWSLFLLTDISPRRQFKHVDSVYSVRRRDVIYNNTGALTYKFNKTFSATGSYSYYKTHSNIANYTYHRQVAGLSFAAQF